MEAQISIHSEEESLEKNSKSGRLGRILWTSAGIFFLLLGVIGIALPLVPTTPFLLLAAACFLRGSKRMYNWMMTNKIFGRYLCDYREGRGIPLKVKIGTLSLLWGVIGLSVLIIFENWIIRLILLIVAIGVTLHILLIKTKS